MTDDGAADRRRSAAHHPDRGPGRRTTPASCAREILRDYRSTLSADHRRLIERFRYVHAARKVVGVGSVGTRAWIMLLVGRDGGRSAVPPGQGGAGVGARAVPRREPVRQPRAAGRRGPAAHAVRERHHARLDPVRRGWTASERDFYVRQLWDAKGSALVDAMKADDDGSATPRVCGWTLARAHARSGDRDRARRLPRSGPTRFDRAIADFAELYADQNERDYARGTGGRRVRTADRRSARLSRRVQLLRRYLPGRRVAAGLRPARRSSATRSPGLSVWALLVPQCLAYATLAGVPVQYGLYTAFAALIAYPVFGTSRQLIQGPSAAVCAVSAAAITPLVGASALGTASAVGYTAALALDHRRRLPRARPAADGLGVDVPLEGGPGGLRARLRDRHRDRPVARAARRRRRRRLVRGGAVEHDRGDPRHQSRHARGRGGLARAAARDAPLRSRAGRGCCSSSCSRSPCRPRSTSPTTASRSPATSRPACSRSACPTSTAATPARCWWARSRSCSSATRSRWPRRARWPASTATRSTPTRS